MSTSYFDVVVLGLRPSALACAALLAKRGFRLLLLGQGDLPERYEIAGSALPRAPFVLTAAHSPAARRVLAELALHQTIRRLAVTADPVLQLALPGQRMDIPLEADLLEREIEREFPSVKRPLDDFLRHTRRTTRELDALVDRDLVWPPETFFERRELARAAAHQPYDRRGGGPDPLADLPDEHPFRTAIQAPVRLTDHMDPDETTPLRSTRLFGSWLSGAAGLDGGAAAFRDMLVEKITTHGGEVRPLDRADRVLTRRGHATGVRIAGSGEEIGCGFVVAGVDLSRVLRLLGDRRQPFEELLERLGEPRLRYYRYTLNAVVAAEGVPEGMARDVFWVRDPKQPLVAENLLHVEAHPADDEGGRLLCIEALLPRRGVEDAAGYLDGLRERILESISDVVPFLDDHLLLVDSPHDGRDARDVRGNRLLGTDRPWTRGPTTMEAIYAYPVVGALGVCALPVRTPVKRMLLCNGQVVPGLGQEGEFLAAWSAARIVTRSDRRKEWMRRGLWTKVEI